MQRPIFVVTAALIVAKCGAASVYDTLENTYTNANGNSLGGERVFGIVGDLQIVDDLTVSFPLVIGSVTVRNLTFGVAPATSAYLRVYQDKDGRPGDEITGPDGMFVPVSESNFQDDIFGMSGRDVCANDLYIALQPGTYWIGLQAISEDWHYTTSGDYGQGEHRLMRDGSRGIGAYGNTEWHNWDGQPDDVNMRLDYAYVPEPSTFGIVAFGLPILLLRHRKMRKCHRAGDC